MVIWESDLRKPPSRAEFSKGTWFLRRLSLNLLPNHILFGNQLWKVRFENGDLRKWFEKTTFMSRILKRNVVFEEIKPESTQKPSLNLLKNHILFGNRLWKVRFENGDLRQWFEKTTFTSRILKRNMVFEEIKPKSTQKPHFFLEIGSEKSDLKMVVWESDLREPPSWAEFSKGMWFLRRLSLNLLKNHILFGNRLWKVRFENGDSRKPPSRAEFCSLGVGCVCNAKMTSYKKYFVLGNVEIWSIKLS